MSKSEDKSIDNYKVGDLILMQDLNVMYISRVELVGDYNIKLHDLMGCVKDGWFNDGSYYEFEFRNISGDILYNFGQIEFESVEQLQKIAPEYFI